MPKSLEYGRSKLSSDATATKTAHAKLTAESPRSAVASRAVTSPRKEIQSTIQPHVLCSRALGNKVGLRNREAFRIPHGPCDRFQRVVSLRWIYSFRCGCCETIFENVWRPDLESESENFGLGFYVSARISSASRLREVRSLSWNSMPTSHGICKRRNLQQPGAK